MNSILGITLDGDQYKVSIGRSFILFNTLEEANEFIERARIVGLDDIRYLIIDYIVGPFISIMYSQLGYRVLTHKEEKNNGRLLSDLQDK